MTPRRWDAAAALTLRSCDVLFAKAGVRWFDALGRRWQDGPLAGFERLVRMALDGREQAGNVVGATADGADGADGATPSARAVLAAEDVPQRRVVGGSQAVAALRPERAEGNDPRRMAGLRREPPTQWSAMTFEGLLTPRSQPAGPVSPGEPGEPVDWPRALRALTDVAGLATDARNTAPLLRPQRPLLQFPAARALGAKPATVAPSATAATAATSNRTAPGDAARGLAPAFSDAASTLPASPPFDAAPIQRGAQRAQAGAARAAATAAVVTARRADRSALRLASPATAAALPQLSARPLAGAHTSGEPRGSPPPVPTRLVDSLPALRRLADAAVGASQQSHASGAGNAQPRPPDGAPSAQMSLEAPPFDAAAPSTAGQTAARTTASAPVPHVWQQLDAVSEDLLIDRLTDRLQERLREQALRQFGFTGGLA